MKFMKAFYTVMLFTVIMKCDKTNGSNFLVTQMFCCRIHVYQRKCDMNVYIYIYFLKETKRNDQKEKETKVLYKLNQISKPQRIPDIFRN